MISEVSMAIPRGWVRPIAAVALAGGMVAAMQGWLPAFEMEVLGRAAAWPAALLAGDTPLRTEAGWGFAAGGLPIVVTRACSGADFHLLATVVSAWHLARRRALLPATAGGLGLGLLVAIVVNALRITLLAQAHRWVIPQFPEAYAATLHLFFGVAVFLPALIGLNFLLDSHARPHVPPAACARTRA